MPDDLKRAFEKARGRISRSPTQAAEPVATQAGYVLMPIERSYDMRVKAIIAFNRAEKDGKDRDDALDAAYQATLAAAPQFPVHESGAKSAGLFVKRSMFGPWIEVAQPEPGAVRLYTGPRSDAREELTDEQRDKIERAEACLRNTGRKDNRDAANGLLDVLIAYPLLPTPSTEATDSDKICAERYRCLRRGQHWSVINGSGDTLRADELDAAIDAARAATAN
ncbi:hypothetical protein [Burkholderia sola]|uniref:hypothetical protein n=1 Tax=Burkholderia sola TaxID=2843302 RepID=UPI0023DDF868|nr:hypothetical protein [Burkholderia sola]MDF3081090.1 hypothetical protein [Burkholderia sola]